MHLNGVLRAPRASPLASIALAIAACLAAPAGAADTEKVEKLIVEKTNQFRRDEGLAPLERDRRLERAAQEFAEHMAKHDKYGHEADGRKPSERARVHGYDYCLVSENISYQHSSVDFATTELAERYVEGWKASPGHRKNMREPAIVDIGAAVARSPKTGRYYGVQMFGRPKSKGMEFQVTNKTNDGVRYQVDGETFSLQPGGGRIHELCVAPDLSLLSREGRRAAPVKVRRGDHFRVLYEDGKLVLRP